MIYVSAMSQCVHKGLADIILEIVEVTPPIAPLSDNGFAAHVEVAMSRSRADVAGQANQARSR